MPRPATHDDLDDYQRQGNSVFHWYNQIAEHPSVEQWIVKAKLEAERLGWEISQSEVRVPLTKAELDAKLDDITTRWDRGAKIYADLEVGPQTYGDLSYSERGAVDYYAEREKVTSPEKLPLPAEV